MENIQTSTAYKVSEDVALESFEAYCNFHKIDIDTTAMDQEDLKGFTRLRRIVILAICTGALVLDKDEAIYTCQMTPGVDSVTMRAPDGAAMMAMDRKKKDQDVAKMFGCMAQMCRIPEQTFSKMHNTDLKVLTALVTLFLG